MKRAGAVWPLVVAALFALAALRDAFFPGFVTNQTGERPLVWTILAVFFLVFGLAQRKARPSGRSPSPS